jgi:hypothetical protein
MVLARIAVADNSLEEAEKELISEAIKALNLPTIVTVERLIYERTSLDILLSKINNPLVKDNLYQSGACHFCDE